MTQTQIISAIKDLNVNKDSTTWDSKTFNLAPHKPFLLLSIIDGIEVGRIKKPHIELSQELIETFFHYWNSIMDASRKTTIALPFFHMKSEPFWELIYDPDKKPYKSSPSLGGLIERIRYANIDEDFYSLMKAEEGKKIIINTILNNYFAQDIHNNIRQVHHINIGAYLYAEQLELLAAEPFEKYHTDNDTPDIYSWQKKQQRQFGFGLKVRSNYKHRCAICRAKVVTPGGESLVDGAHIIPWHKSKNDDPRNGIALCKTHHWMYDKYLLSVSPEYQIKLSSWLKKESDQIDETLKWDRNKILLPINSNSYPSKKALDDHYQKFSSLR